MKVALITGASRGIGKTIALDLTKEGYQVCLVAKTQQHLDEVSEEIKKISAETTPLICPIDVSKETAVQSAVEKCRKEFGQIDVLVNGAGILETGTSELSSKTFHEMLHVNLLGTFYFIQSVAPIMKKQHSGYIFNLASRAGKNGIGSLGGYCASKFAVVGLSEALSLELAEHGVNVTAICPGWVATDMARENSTSPLDEMIKTEDISKTVRYLLSLSDTCSIKEIVITTRSSNISAANSSVKKK